MAKYNEALAIGDAGEFLCGFQFTHLLGWPYRMLPRDLGVDAEIEVLDKDSHSTGEIMKVQVKSQADASSLAQKEHFDFYPKDEHLAYWKSFIVPIIFCGVDLASQRVYWKVIRNTEEYRNAGSGFRISLHKERDLLTNTCHDAFRELFNSGIGRQLAAQWQQIRAMWGIIPKDIHTWAEEEVASADENNAHSFIRQITELETAFSLQPASCDPAILKKCAHMKLVAYNAINRIGQWRNADVEGG